MELENRTDLYFCRDELATNDHINPRSFKQHFHCKYGVFFVVWLICKKKEYLILQYDMTLTVPIFALRTEAATPPTTFKTLD